MRSVKVIKCQCGATVVCEHFTNTCECGRDYNSNGDLLVARHLWGEETGEHPADIANLTGNEDWE